MRRVQCLLASFAFLPVVQCEDTASCSTLREKNERLKRENNQLRKQLGHASWASILAGGDVGKNLTLPRFLQRVRKHEGVLSHDEQLMSEPYANPFAALWWRMTRVLFAAHLLPVDAAGGRHRRKYMSIARYYVTSFMASERVQTAANYGAEYCAEIGDKHFLLATLQTCKNKYAIDIKDVKADVLMNMMTPDWTLPGVTKGKYQVIVMNEVLEHIQQPEKALDTISKLLAPGGVLLMTTPFLVAYHANPDDHNRYTPSAVRLMLEHAGLEAEHVEGHGNWLAATGFAAGFSSTELDRAQLDTPDWLENNERNLIKSRPYHVTVVAIGRKPRS